MTGRPAKPELQVPTMGLAPARVWGQVPSDDDKAEQYTG